jgi:hypothetical protein
MQALDRAGGEGSDNHVPARRPAGQLGGKRKLFPGTGTATTARGPAW